MVGKEILYAGWQLLQPLLLLLLLLWLGYEEQLPRRWLRLQQLSSHDEILGTAPILAAASISKSWQVLANLFTEGGCLLLA